MDGEARTPHTGAASPAVRRIVDTTKFDLGRTEEAVRELLLAIGADLESDGMEGTPRRVALSLAELVTPVEFATTTFANEGRYDELVVVRDIAFQSLCMHHLLPFHGVAHVAYMPRDTIVGISKLARVVELFARDLQLQERMTVQIADWLEQELQPHGIGVVLEAEHSCMTIRGVRKAGAKTVTSALRGSVREDARTRQELMSLVH
jgi:GTP cyclohydrolase I